MEKLFEELFDLLEEYINELDDETVQAVYDKRKENAEKACNKYNKLRFSVGSDKNEDEVEAAKKEYDKEWGKFSKNSKLNAQRQKRLEKKLEDFKKRYANKVLQTAAQTQQAASDHANAMIDQHYRNKLEKVFSSECLEEITSLIRESLEEITKKNLEETPIGSKEWYKAMSQAVRATTAKTKNRLQRSEEGKPMLDERSKAERKQATSDYLRRK